MEASYGLLNFVSTCIAILALCLTVLTEAKFDCKFTSSRNTNASLLKILGPKNGSCLFWNGLRYSQFTCEGNGNHSVTIQQDYHNGWDICLECSAEFPLDLALDPKTILNRAVVRFGKHLTLSSRLGHWVRISSNEETWNKFCDVSRLFNADVTFFSTRNTSNKITVTISVPPSPHKNAGSLGRLVSLRVFTGKELTEDVALVGPDGQAEDLVLGVLDGRVLCRASTKMASIRIHRLVEFGTNPTAVRLQINCLLKDEGCPAVDSERYDECTLPGIRSQCKALYSCHSCNYGVAYCTSGDERILAEFFTPVGNREISIPIASMQDKDVIQFASAIRSASRLAYHSDIELFESIQHELACEASPFFLVAPFVWTVEFKNGSEAIIFVDDEPEDKKTVFGIRTRVSFFELRPLLDWSAIICSAQHWNSNKRAKVRQKLRIYGSSEYTAPSFQTNESSHYISLGSPFRLACKADAGISDVSYHVWLKEKPVGKTAKIIDTFSDSESEGHVFGAQRFDSSHIGDWVCVAGNSRGKATRIFKVRAKPEAHAEMRAHTWEYVGSFLGVIALLGGIIAALWRRYVKQRGHLSTLEIQLFQTGKGTDNQQESFANENAQFLPYNQDFEVKWEDFCIVYTGTLTTNNRTIAVKTNPPGSEKATLLAMLAELKLMIYIERHEHIVTLIGACTEFLKEGRVYVLVDYCRAGSLDTFLVKNACQFERNLSPSPNSDTEMDDFSDYDMLINKQDLISWALQIALGMQHLESKKVIHGDLACRNVLLCTKSHAKIADFGLSRHLLDSDSYTKKSKAKLPWPWMAVESLKSLTFTTKTDVWAYGVTIWEIFTLGHRPYAGICWTNEFVQYLDDNLRLSPPKFATDKMYKLMRQCWDGEPKNRPNFKEIEESILSMVP